ncbi:MAG: hypothetical protein COA97_07595 [Flavobacteriales bacterium]|nr:MAG: hypothetical protein COA97_07595 [Flavobacteriales bacterium]
MDEEMYIINALCYNCETLMKVALIRSDGEKRGSTTSGPKAFNSKEIALAISKGVEIEEFYFNEEPFVANTCKSCGKFIGEHYLFTNYFHLAECGELAYEIIDL